MRITVFGAGYVGLVQAAVLADVGHDLVCVDLNADKVVRLQCGDIPFYEPGLADLVRATQELGRLTFTTDAERAVAHGEVQFIAVGTPDNDDGSVDLKAVLGVAQTLAERITGTTLVVIKSTAPVGTAERVRGIVRAGLVERGLDPNDVEVASNPEFLREGTAVGDCTNPDRIIIGASDPEAVATLKRIYAPIADDERIIVMTTRSAELSKYAANSMLATKISFINEIANLAEKLGADVRDVRRGIGTDPRIGFHFINPGIGYGGSCLPKDVKAMVHMAETAGFDAHLMKAVELRNEKQKRLLADKIMRHFDGKIAGRTFALWGLAFKPDTDDMRAAPARAIMEALWAAGAHVRAFDPHAMDECRRIYGDRADLTLYETAEAALSGADALIVATELSGYPEPDFKAIAGALKQPVIFDGRNALDAEAASRAGVTVHGIGRGRE